MVDHALFNVFVYLAAAVVTVPVASRLGLGSVLGYLLAGIIIGPWCLGLITDAHAMRAISEFGVVLLLFLVGLELSPEKLWQLRGPIFGGGGAQLLGCTAAIAALLWLTMAMSWQATLIGAAALALSSTAMVLQILSEKHLLNTPAGHTGFSILLFQDLAVIPLMAMLPLLASGASSAGGHGGRMALEAVAAVVGIVVMGHFALRPVLRYIATTGVHEIFVAFALFLVIGIALLMESVGLSMALGSFIAGILLADSEYRHALETVIDPFKGLLMGLFFIAVGMAVDFGLLREHAGLVALLVVGLVLLKIAVLYLLSRFAGIPLQQRPFFAIVLSQGGEFAFVLLSLAGAQGVVGETQQHLLMLVVAMSMLTTPLLVLLHDKLIAPRFNRAPDRSHDPAVAEQENPVIIAGFGRFGQVVGRLLMANDIGVTLLDHDPAHIERSREFGFKVYFGSASRLDLLRAAGMDRVKVLVVAVDNPKRASKIVALARQYFPQVRIVARARDMNHLFDFMEHNVRYAYRESFDGAINAAQGAMEALGLEPEEITTSIARFRDYDHEVLETMYRVRHDGDAVMAAASRQLQEQFHAMELEARARHQAG
ncbi:MAG: monovalent cation:proton antiporter-2 (CPA2) family protein [Mariprofundales bacterium]|nr:monovalent cation:proton antiporter-2 (CPA2) family protein [Mariprofundales bacterium]